jgi:hypothetical protein
VRCCCRHYQVLHALTITDVSAMHVVHQPAEDVAAALILMIHREL